ncbi:hypothetical protein [Acerihabitans sp.]|uniref:hypothetical protein n=1 Tax=Acerihabitans sp. TaxID=2811394 RepID=UPI002EDAA052
MMDLNARRVIGWAIFLKGGALPVIAVLDMARQTRGHPKGIVLHKVSQFGRRVFLERKRRYRMTKNMRRHGHRYYNAAMGKLLISLKNNRLPN